MQLWDWHADGEDHHQNHVEGTDIRDTDQQWGHRYDLEHVDLKEAPHHVAESIQQVHHTLSTTSK